MERGFGRSGILALVLVIMLLGLNCAWAADEEEKPTANVSVDILNQYVWRGFALSDHSAVIQPSITGAYKGFSINLWGNLDTDENVNFGEGTGHANWNETDLTVAYTHEIYGGLSGNVGFIYYSLVGDDSNEVYAGLSYTFPWFTIGMTGYREVANFPGWWAQLDLSKNIPLPCNMSLDLSASFGYMSVDKTDYSALHSGQLMAALNIPIGKIFSLSPRVGYTFPLSDDAQESIRSTSWDAKEQHVFGGLRLSAAF